MHAHNQEMHVFWSGPHSWPKFESATGLPPLPRHSGVYLLTFEHRDGYLVYVAGITRQVFRKRFMQHTREYMAGRYNILDPVQAQNGVRSEVWHGWGEARKPERRAEWETRKAELQDAARRELAEFRLFGADVELQKRVPERLEAAIMIHLYAAPAPFCDVPDKGMFLAPRLPSEEPITVLNACTSRLHCLPERLSI